MSVGSPLVCINAAEIAELEERLALKYTEKQVYIYMYIHKFCACLGACAYSTGVSGVLVCILCWCM